MAYIETIHERDATGELADLYRRGANPDGTVDNVLKLHALNPPTLLGHLEVYISAMHRPSPLSRAERELIAVHVSRLNGCDYCTRHHHAGLVRLDPDRPETTDALLAGRGANAPGLSDRERAMLAYAEKLATRPGDMTRSDADHLRTAGLDDRSILDLAHVVAYFCYVNRLVTGLGAETEGDGDELGQWPESDA